MDNKYLVAAKLYTDMLENHRNIVDDPTDIESADRFLEAAVQLSELNLPNPFANLDGYQFSYNSAVRPSSESRIITAVVE